MTLTHWSTFRCAVFLIPRIEEELRVVLSMYWMLFDDSMSVTENVSV